MGARLITEAGKKIVQQWYFGEDGEPSIVTIKLHPDKDETKDIFIKIGNFYKYFIQIFSVLYL